MGSEIVFASRGYGAEIYVEVGIVTGVRGLVDKLAHRQIVIIASKHGAVYKIGFFCAPILQSGKKTSVSGIRIWVNRT